MATRLMLLAHALNGQGGLIRGQNFIRNLNRSGKDRTFLITVCGDCGYESLELPKNCKLHIFPKYPSPLKRLFFELVALPKLINEFNPDAVLGMGNHGVLRVKCPQAIWVTNGYLVYPNKHFAAASLKTKLHVKLQRFYFRKVLLYKPLIFCQTPVMKSRIASYYSYPEDRIKVLPNAISEFICTDAPPGEQKRPDSIPPDKFNCLVLSYYYVHKNPQIILDTCLRYRAQLKNFRFITTISKDDCPEASMFLDDIKKYQLQDTIVNVGKIAHSELGNYYKNSQLVISPTLMESFSVTYLEAMHFGVPILTTDLDFAHYLCGNAAAYYDPWDNQSFYEQLMKLKSDQQYRENLIISGRQQERIFGLSWADIAEDAISNIEQMIESGR